MNRLEVQQRCEHFRDRCQPNLYDYFYAFRPYHLVSCCGWGQALSQTNQGSLCQEIYFGTRADEASVFRNQKWLGQPSLLSVAEVDIAQPGFTLKNAWVKPDSNTNIGIGGANT